MAVKYLAGNRIIGTAAERLALQDLTPTNQISTIGSDTIIKFTQHTGNQGDENGGNDTTYNFTFTPAGSFNIRYLIVGGGGGGGFGKGGGGGAGGYLADSSYAVTNQAYTITVGNGGRMQGTGAYGAWAQATGYGTNGSPSSINPASGTNQVAGGGGEGAGVRNDFANGASGGSGGGGKGQHVGGSGGTASGTGTGNGGGNGGSGQESSGCGGAGGGAGAAGGNGTGASGADGGIGLQNDITGTNTYYAGGGASANRGQTGTLPQGGLGGGGGTNALQGSHGADGFGGGGAGSHTNGTTQGSGQGGAGVIFIRFASSESYTITANNSGDTPTEKTTYQEPSGFIFEESDTGKHYMFDGTQTWNEL